MDTQQSADVGQNVLVLQGGGALGAYQAGVVPSNLGASAAAARGALFTCWGTEAGPPNPRL